MKRLAPFLALLAFLAVLLVVFADPAGQRTGAGASSPDDEPVAPAAAEAAAAAGPAGTAARAAAAGRTEIDPAAAAGRWALELSDAAGAALAATPLLLWRDGQVLFRADTDARGRVETAADDLPAELFVAAAGRPLHRAPVTLSPGSSQVALPEGGVVSGQARLEDGGPAEGLLLFLDSDHPVHPQGRIPEEVFESLGLPANRGILTLRCTPDAAGHFRFSGLPEGWSGELLPRNGYAFVAASTGGLLYQGRQLRLTEAWRDLSLTLRPEFRLSGRLVLAADGAPAPGVPLDLRYWLRSPRAGTVPENRTMATTEPDGRFGFRPKAEAAAEIDRLEIVLRGDPARGAVFATRGADVAPDGELGTIRIGGLRDAPFRLVDDRGAPIAGGIAKAGSTRSRPTDSKGLGVLRSLPRTQVELRAEADGYLPTRAALPESILEPVTVILPPANRLVIELRPPAGARPDGFVVALGHPERLLEPAGERSSDLFAHVADPQWWKTQTSREDEITRVNNPVGEDGRAVFRALRPGVEFELTVHGASSDDVLHQERVPPLAADESRHMVVELGDGLRVFRGHVLDQAGLPLVRAHLQHGNQILGWTDDAGAFAAYVTTAEPKTLLVSHDTCATIYLEEYLIPSDGQPVEFRLDPGYTVVIEVVDEDGAPVLGAEVRTRKKGFTTNTLDLGGGRHQASRLSADPIQIGTRVMGLSLTQDHDPAMPVARVVVPTRSAGGKVVVALTGAREWPEAWIYMLMLHPRGVEGAESQRIYPLRPDDGPFEFAFVVPGTYRATLFAFPPPGAENQDYEDIADVELEVELGRTTRVELDVTPR